MATVFRPPLISRPPPRSWINGIHDQGANGVPQTILSIAGQTPPVRQHDWPTPPERPYPLLLRTWISQNPNLRPGVSLPPGKQIDFSAPAGRPYGIHLRTWTSGNPSLRPPASIKPKRWIDFPVPPNRPYDASLRTWTFFNSSTTVNKFPFGKSTDFTAPRERPYGNHLLTWANFNPNIYAGLSLPPGGRTDFSPPLERPYIARGYSYSTPYLIPPAAPSSSVSGKQFIGEIQSLGIGSIFDSSMGVT